jgi:hypothetical protein
MNDHPSPDTLVDYLAGELAGDDQTALEDHLFECRACARAADALGATADAVRTTVAAGKAAMSASGALIERLEQDGMKIRHNHARPGDTVPCSVGADDDYVATHLCADFTGIDQVDVVTVRFDGVEMRRIANVPVGPGSAEVTVLTRADRIRSMPTVRFQYRLLSNETLIAEYTFHHTGFVP